MQRNRMDRVCDLNKSCTAPACECDSSTISARYFQKAFVTNTYKDTVILSQYVGIDKPAAPVAIAAVATHNADDTAVVCDEERQALDALRSRGRLRGPSGVFFQSAPAVDAPYRLATLLAMDQTFMNGIDLKQMCALTSLARQEFDHPLIAGFLDNYHEFAALCVRDVALLLKVRSAHVHPVRYTPNLAVSRDRPSSPAASAVLQVLIMTDHIHHHRTTSAISRSSSDARAPGAPVGSRRFRAKTTPS